MAKTSQRIKSERAPRKSCQHRNRCRLCGRARGYYRKFQVCRSCFRALAHKGEVPGVKKASW